MGKARVLVDGGSPAIRSAARVDQALTPVRDDDEQTLDLLTKTAGGKAAVKHLKKVHDITHSKTAAVA